MLDHVCGPEFVSYLGVLGKWGTLVSYNAFAGLPEENLMGEMRKYLDVCPAVRCFSFHIYDHDRDARRAIMGKLISLLGRGGDQARNLRAAEIIRGPAGAHAAGVRRRARQDHR